MNPYLEKCARILANVTHIADTLHKSHADEALSVFRKHADYVSKVVERRHPNRASGLGSWAKFTDDVHSTLRSHGPLKTDMMALHNKYSMKAKASGIRFEPKASANHFIDKGHATPDSSEVDLLG